MRPDAHENTVNRPADTAGSLSGAVEETASPVSATKPDCESPPFAASSEPGEVGRLGKYRIQRELGRGGMGAVYLAFDERLQRKVALKVMLPKAAANATARDRFLREARAAAQISSDHVVNIYEADEIDGVPFIALQYLQGYPLDEYLKKKGTPTLQQLIRLGRETALGLAAAHKLGMVHRDIKPGNVWLEAPGGRVKILDFGLAKPVVGKEHAELTASGAIVGTPAYMAPEQGMGHRVDARADLFSLGCMLYRLACGRLPFEGPTLMAILTAIATQDPTPVRAVNPAVPEPLADLIHGLLAKNPADRPATATDVAKELEVMGGAAPKKSTDVNPDMATVTSPQVVYMPIAVSVQGNNPFENLAADEPSSAEEDPTRLEPKPKAFAKRGKSPPWPLIAGAVFGFLLLAGVGGFIIIKITNKDGTTTEIKVPEGSKVEVSKDGKPVVTVNPDGKAVTPLPPTPREPATPPPVKATAVNRETGLPAGKSGLRFEPSDRAVAVKVPLRSTTVVTVEAWVTFEAVRESGGGEFIRTPNGNINTDYGRLRVYSFHGHADAGDPVPKGRRVHVAAVNDGKKRYLYLDGKRVAESEDAGEPVPENEQRLAGEKLTTIVLGSELVTGTIDAVRVSTTAKYDKEFTPPEAFAKDKDTLALYLFDEGKGDTLNDSSGNGYHAKIVGAKWVKGDPERAVAEWVLSRGGRVEARGLSYQSLPLPSGDIVVTQIDLSSKTVEDADLARLSGLKYLEQLNLGNSPRVTAEGLKHLSGLRALKGLHLPNMAPGGEIVAPLLPLVGLESLELPAGVSDADLERLVALKKLKRLIARFSALTDDGLKPLLRLPELEGVTLDRSPRITDRGAAVLAAIPRLKMVGLSKTGVGDDGWRALAKLPALESAHANSPYTEGTLKALASVRTLQHIGDYWDGVFLHCLKDHPSLRQLSISNPAVDDDAIPTLASLKKLHTLYIMKCGITPAGFEKLKAALPNCRITSDYGTYEPK